MALTISSLTTEFVRAEVTAPANPTGLPVEFAFKASGVEPGALDWQAGAWEATSVPYVARILVGPAGTVTLPDGTYKVWLRITASPEIPVRQFDTLKVT